MSAVSIPDRGPIIVGIILLASAVVVAFDANRIQSGFTYGISPAAVPYVVAAFLALLGVGHFVAAFRSENAEAEPADWSAVLLMAGGLLGLMASIAIGGGFIVGAALLFALTARSFGRRALPADLAIGTGLGLVIFLTFNKLLSLTLPMGPIERLF
ncbi:tripartite tricarboxylate transporter TctB family protein [Agrobacterium pusense]|uniref:tripartite tricarboxylate transporter TctB family protein n=1 Tax=Agrobacterium pusense TaxID=648995 RepID=UPI001C6E4E47|nr:tripartite tricarboxylate transporter TctB family protein [Agrobacterium pusense]MBW9060393.1 tripartite tricarboxylate transporter TctB family protein [Agrobacterium pusense]